MSSLKSPRKERRQVKKWACHKLECLGEYLETYAAVLKKASCYFLELFAGGSIDCNSNECPIDSPELGALKTKSRFTGYLLLTRDQPSQRKLKKLAAPYNGSISIITGNPINDRVIKELYDIVPRSAASLALIDPPGYRKLRWTTIKKLAAHGLDWQGHKTELLIIFPLEMALARNLTRPQCEASITRFYGNSQWLEIRQKRRDNKIGPDEARRKLVELYKTSLKKLGYRYVSSLTPARFSNPPFYHIIWASDKDGQKKTLKKAFTRERYLPCELFHSE